MIPWPPRNGILWQSQIAAGIVFYLFLEILVLFCFAEGFHPSYSYGCSIWQYIMENRNKEISIIHWDQQNCAKILEGVSHALHPPPPLPPPVRP